MEIGHVWDAAGSLNVSPRSVSGLYANWAGVLAAAVVMLVTGVRLRLLSLPEWKTRCGACGRLHRPGGTPCPCSKPH